MLPDKDKDGAFTSLIEEKKEKEDFKFSGVFFPGRVVFNDFKFTKNVEFNYANFNNGASFIKTIFEQRTNFIGSIFSKKTYFYEVSFSNAYSNKSDIFYNFDRATVLENAQVLFERVNLKENEINNLNYPYFKF